MPAIVRNLAGLVGFFALWEVAVRSGWVDPRFVPPPSREAARLVELLGQADFQRDLIATVLTWLIALGVAAAIALPVGLLLGSIAWARRATQVLIELLRPLPPVAIIPLLVLFLGSGPETKITLAVYAAVWPMLFNVVYAMDDLDPLLLDTARSFGHRRPRILATVVLPAVAPFALTGVRVSAAIALVVTIGTEYLASSQVGVGAYLIEVATTSSALGGVLAATVVIGLIGSAANGGLEWLGRRLFGWTEATDTGGAR